MKWVDNMAGEGSERFQNIRPESWRRGTLFTALLQILSYFPSYFCRYLFYLILFYFFVFTDCMF